MTVIDAFKQFLNSNGIPFLEKAPAIHFQLNGDEYAFSKRGDDLLEIWLLNLCDTSNASKDELPDIFDAINDLNHRYSLAKILLVDNIIHIVAHTIISPNILIDRYIKILISQITKMRDQVIEDHFNGLNEFILRKESRVYGNDFGIDSSKIIQHQE